MSGAQPQPQARTKSGSAAGEASDAAGTAEAPAAAKSGASGGAAGTAGSKSQPQPQPEAQPQPQPQPQPHHPPQAYPAPPSGAPQEAPGGIRRPRTGARTLPRTRKARLRVAKADPWSVMKVSFLLSIALGLCTVVAASVLWMVMDAMGVFSAIGGTVNEATGSGEGGGFDLESFLSLPRVLLFTSVIAVIDVVLATALATLGAFIYNLSAGFVGGVELTLAEDE